MYTGGKVRTERWEIRTKRPQDKNDSEIERPQDENGKETERPQRKNDRKPRDDEARTTTKKMRFGDVVTQITN